MTWQAQIDGPFGQPCVCNAPTAGAVEMAYRTSGMNYTGGSEGDFSKDIAEGSAGETDIPFLEPLLTL